MNTHPIGEELERFEAELDEAVRAAFMLMERPAIRRSHSAFLKKTSAPTTVVQTGNPCPIPCAGAEFSAFVNVSEIPRPIPSC